MDSSLSRTITSSVSRSFRRFDNRAEMLQNELEFVVRHTGMDRQANEPFVQRVAHRKVSHT